MEKLDVFNKVKNKIRGFTLIEVLTILVVLAAVTLIAVPIVNNVIKESKKESFAINAKLILKQALNEKTRDDAFDLEQVNPENMYELLAVVGDNYSSVKFKEYNDKIFINISGIKKWEGLSACGAYDNITVVEGECQLDSEPPTITFDPDGSLSYIKSSRVQVGVVDAFLIEDSLKYVWTTTEELSSTDDYVNSFVNSEYIQMPTDNGSFYLHVIAKDALNNTSEEHRNFLLDNEAPVITVIGDLIVTINKGSTYIDAGAIVSDNFDGDVELTITGMVNPQILGTYKIIYTAKDDAGNITTAERVINVIDVNAPIITINGNNPTNVNVENTYIDAGATAIDDADGDVTNKIVVTGSVNTKIPGTYTITYTVSDMAGNVSNLTRMVNVIDNVGPTITFGTNGNSTYAKSRSTTVTVNDVHSAVNAGSLKYLWNTSTITPSENSFTTTFTNGGTINTPANVTGTYYLWVLAKDTAGNTTIKRSNGFNLDNTKPVIAINGALTININVGTNYTDAGATASDEHSGINGSITTTGTVDKAKPGTYTITYNVSDHAGNAANPVIRTINVIDNIGPTIIFGTNGNTTYQKNSSSKVTVSDAHSSINLSSLKYLWNTSTSTPSEGSFTTTFTNDGTVTTPANLTGTYYLWIIAKDAAGNSTIARSNDFKLDNVAPQLVINGANNMTIGLGSSYADAGATATDNINGNLTPTVLGSVNANKTGTYTITYTAIDTAGNTTTAIRYVSVGSITQFRFRTLLTSCSTCYETCYNYADGTPKYSCSSGTLSGTSCVSSSSVYSTFYRTYKCVNGSWSFQSGSCSGNCNQPCSNGGSANGYETSNSCPSGSCSGSSTVNCSANWQGSCTSTTSATVTYTCPSGYTGGGSSSSCSQSYSCNSYQCDCSSSWSSWSQWDTTPVSGNSTKDVETRVCTSWPC